MSSKNLGKMKYFLRKDIKYLCSKKHNKVVSLITTNEIFPKKRTLDCSIYLQTVLKYYHIHTCDLFCFIYISLVIKY